MEPDEFFQVALSGSGINIDSTPVQGMLRQDEVGVAIAARQASQAEGTVFSIRREAPVFRDNLLAASGAFWRAHLAGDADARHWLNTTFPGQLRPEDRFETK